MWKVVTTCLLSAGLISLAIHSSSYAGSSASASATATTTILVSISMSKVQDLNFGVGSPGDPEKVASPLDSMAARFNVMGNPNSTYLIVLPSDGAVKMSDGMGNSISLSSFSSYPKSNGELDSSGAQRLNVAATRSAIDAHQAPGIYSGSFTVTVIYP